MPETNGYYAMNYQKYNDCARMYGRWIGMANFCPWCGRVIRWTDKDDEPK